MSEDIRDDRTAGASELARRAVEILARHAREGGGMPAVLEERARLAGLRPSMAAIEGALAIFVEVLEGSVPASPGWDAAVERARSLAVARLEDARAGVAAHGARLLGELAPARVVTISCSSTVRAVLEARPPASVLVSEGRPGMEGRAIAEGLADLGTVTLCTDAALPGLLAPGDLVLTGADAVEADGNLVNKVGTLGLAVAARRLGVPFYAAAERFKFLARSGIVLEEKEGSEVWPGAPARVTVRNPYFERTPGDLVTGFVTDGGVLAWSGGAFRAA